MSNITTTTFSAHTQKRLAAYSAAVGASLVGAAALPTGAQAAVVSSGPVNIVVPNTIDGIYINFATGVTGTSGGAVPGFDFNPYSSGGSLLFYWGGSGSANGGVASSTTGPYLVLGQGSVISGSSIFSQSANGASGETALFQAGVNGYLGVKFTNESTGALNYGYVHLQTTGATGYPATILDYSYDNTGGAITIGAVPEPGTTAALALGALSLGAMGVRRWRQNKQAVA